MTTLPALPSEFPASTIELNRADLRAYAEASGDDNPIHLEDEAAQALGLPGVIAHGMLTWAQVLGKVAEWAGGAERIYESQVRFAQPVVVPADGVARIEISGRLKPPAEDTGMTTLLLTATCDGVKIYGKARVDLH